MDITRTGQEETVDGVRIVFQLTPGTEAPAEMNFLFPDQRALCLAENATHNMHNILTLRGAVVRDSRIWARYLDEAIEFFDGQYDVAFASHHWPTWGHDNVVQFLGQQRDLYAYMHDQTLRMLNSGLTGPEIAEEMQLPPAVENSWHARGYYGSLSHNVKAIYQRYLGWFNGNVATLWEHPPVELAKRYVDLAGGAEAALAKARTYIDDGDLRFAATLLNHVIFADPSNADAKQTLAGVYDTLGHGSENGTWRNFYLNSAMELRHGENAIALDTTNPEMAMALTTGMLLDSIAVRIDGPRAWDEDLTIDLVLTDENTRHRLTLHNGALTHRETPTPKTPAGLTLTLTKPHLLGILADKGLDDVQVDGDPSLLARLFSYVTEPDKAFSIVTPDDGAPQPLILQTRPPARVPGLRQGGRNGKPYSSSGAITQVGGGELALERLCRGVVAVFEDSELVSALMKVCEVVGCHNLERQLVNGRPAPSDDELPHPGGEVDIEVVRDEHDRAADGR